MRRILHIGKFFPPHRGGMETVLRDTMNLQSRQGIAVSAVVHSSERRLTSEVDSLACHYRVIRAPRWFSLAFAPIAPTFVWSLYKELSQFQPDSVHIHMPNLSAFWLLALSSARKIPWKIFWHSDVVISRHTPLIRLLYWWYRPFERLLLSKAEQIVVSSPPYLETSEPLKRFQKKCVVEQLQIDSGRIPVSELAVRKSAVKRLQILCVGRLTYYKDFGTAIRAVARMSDATLNIVGDGAEKNSLEKLILSLGVSDRVRLLGELPETELWEQYRLCDVLCLTSIERTEAFGVVILEAAVFGKPSVVADTAGSGMSWVINQVSPPGKTFRAGDPENLAQVLAHYQEAKRFTEAAEALDP